MWNATSVTVRCSSLSCSTSDLSIASAPSETALTELELVLGMLPVPSANRLNSCLVRHGPQLRGGWGNACCMPWQQPWLITVIGSTNHVHKACVCVNST